MESNSFCYAAMCFPHIGIFSFLHRECINLLKGRLRDKIYLNSILKGCFFFVKRFCPIIRAANNNQEKFTSSAHRISVIQTETRFCYMEVGWKIKDEYIYCFMKFS